MTGQNAESDYPLTETPQLKVAHMLWQANEGYILAEDRAVGENWMLRDPRNMHEDDARELPGWLSMADAVLAAIGAEVVNLTAENWNPNTATPACDWCGECEWCQNLHNTTPGTTSE